jgi:putative aldouronate transport system permease protein
MLIPAFVALALFSYYPMYGIIIAFKQYEPLVGFARSPWVGFRHFQRMFADPDSWEIFRNTLTIAVGKIVIGQAVSIAFALLLNELRVIWYKRIVQTLSYLLHFLSWMVFGIILTDFLAPQGFLNSMLAAVGLERIYFLGMPSTFQPTVILTDVWKEFAWGAIIYMAALTGIDPSLYEAAAVDGANRWQRAWNITLPGIASTIVLLSCLSLAGVLNAGFEQIFVLYNPRVYPTGDIIDTYVYRAGLLSMQFSFATAMGLLKSVVSLILITLSYYLADRFARYRIF